MDTLALAIIAIGVVAAIGVALVAMTGSGSETAAPAESEAAKAGQPRPRPRSRRRQQAVPKYIAAPPQHNGYSTGTQDPLVTGFMQVVSGELHTLREQQERIDQRLKLINGIAELMHDMQAASANGADHSSSTNHRAAGRG